MKLSQVGMIIMTILFCLSFFLFIQIYATNEATTKNIEEQKQLESCVKDAMVASDISAKNVFASEEVRAEVVRQFYASYTKNHQMYGVTGEQDAKYHVPCILLLDNDGYYVSYTTANKRVDGFWETIDHMTSLQYYTESYGGGAVIINFGLDGSASYIVDSRVVTDLPTRGSFDDETGRISFYNSISKYFSDLTFLRTEERYEEERIRVISSVITTQVNYYINTHNEYYNQYADYKFVMPAALKDARAVTISGPSILAFSQGIQVRTATDYTNVYSLVEYEKKQTHEYCITDTMEYHYVYCTKKSFILGIVKATEEIAYTYKPCPYCILQGD